MHSRADTYEPSGGSTMDRSTPPRTNMRTALYDHDGVTVADVPPPACGSDDVQVRVRAAALNRADLGMAAGHRHGGQGGPGTALGMEWAGEVVALGANVTGFRVGD